MSLRALKADIASMPPVVWVLFAGTFVNRFGSFVLVFLALYLTGKGFSAPQAGIAMGLYGCGAIAASIVGGWLADHFGRRNTIVLSMVMSAGIMVALSQAEGYALLLVLVFIAGFSAEMYRPASSALIADVVEPARRVTAFGLYRLAINLGFAIGPAVGGFVAHKSFFYLFIGDAITSLIYAGIALVALPNRAGAQPVHAEKRSAWHVVRRDGAFIAFLGATLAASAVFMQFDSSYPLQIQAYGHAASTYGLLISLNGLIICLCELPLTAFTRRFPHRRVMITGLLTIGAGFVMTAYVRSVAPLAASVVVWTLGEMLFFPMAAAHVANISPSDMRGRYQGAWGIAWGMGAVVGPVAGTMLFAANPTLLWIIAGITTAVGALLVLPGTRPRDAGHPDARFRGAGG